MVSRFRVTTSPRCWCLPALLLIALIALNLPSTLPAAAQTETESEDDALAASTLTVNVELILDASGSMGELIPGSEHQSRMEAARAAMREVIDRVPERDGLNIGFRVYGHEGSSSDADRAMSCRSTELLVPLDGVDKPALLQRVESFEPTGWTPLARALKEAGRDFAPGGESVTNAIIMVTDGEDTCGGNPCDVAAQLNHAEIALTTYVVGFALTTEQRDAVRCIAEEGGGQLFTAGNAGELSDAIFQAFARVETAPAPVELESEVGGYVGGNAFSLLDAGEPDTLSVIAVGPFDGRELPVVVRNMTAEDVENVQVSVIARAGGELLASGATLRYGLLPNVVKAGELAIGVIAFGPQELPDDVEFEFEITATPLAGEPSGDARDLTVEEVNVTEQGLIGILRNDTEEALAQVVNPVVVACFDETGRLLDVGEWRTDKSALAPDETTTFEIGVPSMGTGLETESCPAFLVAGYSGIES